MNTKHIGFLAVLASFISACKVSKDVGFKANALPENYRWATAVDTNTVAKLPWKSFFKDEKLQKIIDTALLKNSDLQLAIQNLAAAEQVLKQAKWNNVPSVAFNTTASLNRPSNNSLNGLSLSQFLGSSHIEDYNTNVSLSWEADIWGKINNRKQETLANYLQTEEATKAVKTQVVANVAKSYYSILLLDKQLAIAKKNLELSDSTLQVIKLQYSAGQITVVAVQQAQGLQLVASQLVPQFEQQLAIQENALSILIGKLPDAILRAEDLEQTQLPENSATGFPSALLSLRPDIKSAELAVRSANYKIGAAQASMYPSLSITAQGGVNAFKASNWFNIPASLFGTVAGNLAQPLLQRRQLKTNLELAKIEKEKAVVQFRQRVLNAVGEVSDVLVSMDKLGKQQEFAQQRSQTLQNATKNAKMLFENGMANYLEVITAQSNALQTELEVATLKKAQLDARIDLYRSLGGGWN